MASPNDDLPYPLVSTAWLADHLDDPDVKIIDGSWRLPGGAEPARAAFLDAHIPGAVFFDLDAVADPDTDLPHMLPTATAFADAVGALGVSDSDRVIVYDEAGLFSAARVWWTFRAFGHAAVAVLDGGLPKWRAEGRPVESGAPAPRPAAYRVAASAPFAVADAAMVRRAIDASDRIILDARPQPRFAGLAPEPRAGLRGGAMPGARSLPHTELLDDDGALKPPDALGEALASRGVDQNAPVVATCGSGVTAAVIVLALERLGWRGHALYDGAWAEWGRPDEAGERPVVVAYA